MHGSVVDDTVERASRAGTSHACMGHEPDAMQCDIIKKKDITRQSFIEWIQQPSSKGKGVGATYESLFKHFSLKCFLLKNITSLFRKG